MQNLENLLPQADKSLDEQEMNSADSYYRVKAPVAGIGSKDSEGSQKFCMEADITSNSTQGGADDTVQDTVVSEHSGHSPNAPKNGAGNKQLSYADHLKVFQSIAGGAGSLDEGLDQTALEKPPAFRTSVIKEAIQAMEKQHADMQKAYASFSQAVQKNSVMPIKKGVNLFGNVLVHLDQIRKRLDGETKEMESAHKKVADKKSSKRVRSLSSGGDSSESRHFNKRIPQNNLSKASNIATPDEEQQKITKLQEEERRKMLHQEQESRKRRGSKRRRNSPWYRWLPLIRIRTGSRLSLRKN